MKGLNPLVETSDHFGAFLKGFKTLVKVSGCFETFLEGFKTIGIGCDSQNCGVATVAKKVKGNCLKCALLVSYIEQMQLLYLSISNLSLCLTTFV